MVRKANYIPQTSHSFRLTMPMTNQSLLANIAQLIPLVDAALTISRDKELMDILTRIAHNPEPIDRSSCTVRERQVWDALSCGSKREQDLDDANVSIVHTFFHLSCEYPIHSSVRSVIKPILSQREALAVLLR